MSYCENNINLATTIITTNENNENNNNNNNNNKRFALSFPMRILSGLVTLPPNLT